MCFRKHILEMFPDGVVRDIQFLRNRPCVTVLQHKTRDGGLNGSEVVEFPEERERWFRLMVRIANHRHDFWRNLPGRGSV